MQRLTMVIGIVVASAAVVMARADEASPGTGAPSPAVAAPNPSQGGAANVVPATPPAGSPPSQGAGSSAAPTTLPAGSQSPPQGAAANARPATPSAGNPPSPQGAAPVPPPGAPPGGPAPTPQTPAPVVAAKPPLRSSIQSVAPEVAEAILGQRITDRKGNEIGRLVDVLVDANGQPQAAVIDFGGFMGVGNRKVAVHWSVLHFNPGDPKHKVMLEMTPDQIKAAPEYLNSNKPAPVVTPVGIAPAAH